jgi:hypothetical protein
MRRAMNSTAIPTRGGVTLSLRTRARASSSAASVERNVEHFAARVLATGDPSAAEGAPVAKTLAAKCSTLRSTLAADDEAKARVRNDKVTPPLVGMALLFMALLIYPALSL